MAVYEFPLLPAQAQEMQITLATQEYTVRFYWIDSPEGGWIIDIYDLTFEPLVRGLALTAGENVLQQFDYLGFPGAITVQVDEDPLLEPTFAGLGVTGRVMFTTP